PQLRIISIEGVFSRIPRKISCISSFNRQSADWLGIAGTAMWKGKKPERDKEPSAAISKFQEGKTMETWLEPKSTPAEKEIINVGKSVSIKGDLTGDEDLTIDGQADGKIELQGHDLVIGSHGKVNAQINAKNVIVMGRVAGKIYAAD